VAAIGVIVVILTANWDGDAGRLGTGLMLLASAGATFAAILVAMFLRRVFRRPADDDE
jgi:hypothetical protein